MSLIATLPPEVLPSPLSKLKLMLLDDASDPTRSGISPPISDDEGLANAVIETPVFNPETPAVSLSSPKTIDAEKLVPKLIDPLFPTVISPTLRLIAPLTPLATEFSGFTSADPDTVAGPELDANSILSPTLVAVLVPPLS